MGKVSRKPQKTDNSPPATASDDLWVDRGKRGVFYRLELTRSLVAKSQKDFVAKTGVSQSGYSNLKKGDAALSVEHAHNFCDKYNLTLDWIYRGDPADLDKGLREALWAAHKHKAMSH